MYYYEKKNIFQQKTKTFFHDFRIVFGFRSVTFDIKIHRVIIIFIERQACNMQWHLYFLYSILVNCEWHCTWMWNVQLQLIKLVERKFIQWQFFLQFLDSFLWKDPKECHSLPNLSWLCMWKMFMGVCYSTLDIIAHYYHFRNLEFSSFHHIEHKRIRARCTCYIVYIAKNRISFWVSNININKYLNESFPWLLVDSCRDAVIWVAQSKAKPSEWEIWLITFKESEDWENISYVKYWNSQHTVMTISSSNQNWWKSFPFHPISKRLRLNEMWKFILNFDWQL